MFERRLPGAAWWLVAAFASCALYLPALVVGMDQVVKPLEPTFQGSALHTPFLITVLALGLLGWFGVPLGWLALWSRACRRWGACVIRAERATFVHPAQVKRMTVDLSALRVVDCTPWGVLVEADAWDAEVPLGPLTFRHPEERPGTKLLIPCAEADHGRVLSLLGVGPRR